MPEAIHDDLLGIAGIITRAEVADPIGELAFRDGAGAESHPRSPDPLKPQEAVSAEPPALSPQPIGQAVRNHLRRVGGTRSLAEVSEVPQTRGAGGG